jgi:hypothetical protein
MKWQRSQRLPKRKHSNAERTYHNRLLPIWKGRSSPYFRSVRFYDAIPSKRGRVPSVKAIVPPVYEAEVARDGDDALHIFV